MLCEMFCKTISAWKSRLRVVPFFFFFFLIVFLSFLCPQYQGTPLMLLVDVGVNSGCSVALHGLVSGAEAARQRFEPCCSSQAMPFLGIAPQQRCSRPRLLTTTPSISTISATSFARTERIWTPTSPAAVECKRVIVTWGGGKGHPEANSHKKKTLTHPAGCRRWIGV